MSEENKKFESLTPPSDLIAKLAAPEPTVTASSGNPPEGALFDRTYSGGNIEGWTTTQQSPPPKVVPDRDSCPFCGAPLVVVRKGDILELHPWMASCPTTDCPLGNSFRSEEEAEEAMRLRPIDFKPTNDGRWVLK